MKKNSFISFNFIHVNNDYQPIMLLPIFLVWILASTNANWLDDAISKIPRVDPFERIPSIPDLLQPTYSEDTHLTTMELISKYGYDGELHEVITSDGYILEIHRIKGRINSTQSDVQKPIVLLIHGILVDGSSWVLAGRSGSLAFILADAGYDVWIGNVRGTPYSSRHIDPNISPKAYWDFSFHEMGTRDVPAMIDEIVKTTGRKKMYYLGYSQGTTMFFAMASTRPQYQENIEAMYAMAPIVYSGRMKSPIIQFLAQYYVSLHYLLDTIGVNELNPNNDFLNAIEQIVCEPEAISQPICSNLLFLLVGFNPEQFNKALLPVVLGHSPVTISTRQLVHYGQLIKSGTFLLLHDAGKFKQYDYGIFENERVYGTLTPPEYDLSSIKTPVYMFYSNNDWLSNPKDVEKLYSVLSNPCGKTLIADRRFNHMDYILGKDVRTVVYDVIIDLMNKSKCISN